MGLGLSFGTLGLPLETQRPLPHWSHWSRNPCGLWECASPFGSSFNTHSAQVLNAWASTAMKSLAGLAGVGP